MPCRTAALMAAAAAAVLCGSAARAQNVAAPAIYDDATLAALPRIVTAAQHSDTAYATVAHLSDVIGPRLSGSPQAAGAVEYVAQKMRDLGLVVRLEPVMVPHWVRGDERAELVDWPERSTPTTQKIVLTALGMTPATPAAGITSDIVVVHDYTELNKAGSAVRGKIVLFEERYNKQLSDAGEGGAAYGDAVRYRNGGPAAASRLGAVAALVRSVGGAEFRLPHTGSTGFPAGVTPIPAAALAAEDADLIERLSGRGTVRMHLVLTPQTLPDAPSFNVIGDLPGSTLPDQVVIVSGHLDSWDIGRGAIDDGAGLAQAIGTMSVLHTLGLHPYRTIRCIAWMNEENGTAGGRAYAKDEAARIGDHFAAIESDLGSDHPVGIGTSLSPRAGPWLAPVSTALTAQGSSIQRYSDGSETDIGPIVRLGVPAFAVLQDSRHYFDYHHTAADTLDKVNPDTLAQNTAVLAALAYALANANVPLVREPLR